MSNFPRFFDEMAEADAVVITSAAEGRYARELFNGRIVDVLHETRGGRHWGRVLVSSGASQEPEFRIEIQNEYLAARHHWKTVAIVPDLIPILDAESAEPLTAEMLVGNRGAVQYRRT